MHDNVSNNIVPIISTEVLVSHAVMVNVDETCKSIQVLLFGKIILNTNNKQAVIKKLKPYFAIEMLHI
jgi:hypothetical protein